MPPVSTLITDSEDAEHRSRPDVTQPGRVTGILGVGIGDHLTGARPPTHPLLTSHTPHLPSDVDHENEQ